MQDSKKQEHWSSNWLFVMATIGASVGLANIWRFPFTTGENGGGAFVLIYLAAVLFMALPLLIGELLLGRRGQSSPPVALSHLAREAGASPRWAWLGYLGVVTALIILSYYSMIGGETVIYAFKNLLGDFVAIDPAASLQVARDYNNSWLTVFGAHALFLGIMVLISARGVARGLEQVAKYMMPSLFLLLLGMVLYASLTGEFSRTLAYLFQPDFSKITISVVIEAFGQAFFSIGVGVTILMAYGSYMQPQEPVARSSMIVAGADTLVALLAGLAVFPIVFAYGLDAAGGPGLVFETVPLAFGHMPGGQLFGTVFFVLLAFAALTSAICILEAPVAWLTSRPGWSRKQAALVSGLLVLALGLLPALSLNYWAGFYPLGRFGIERTFFDLFDYLATNILLPVGGLFTALFVGWVLPRQLLQEELSNQWRPFWFSLWLLLLRYLVPFVLVVVFVYLLLP